MTAKKSIASLSLKSGKKDKYFFCLLEHFPEKKRFFLKSVLQVSDEENRGEAGERERKSAIRSWIEKYQVQELIVDFPLTPPICNRSIFNPGGSYDVASYEKLQQKINDILAQDQASIEQNPKQYERDRLQDDLEGFSSKLKNHDKKKSSEPILSRSFKRKLKKGFLPYWNRELDFWVWLNYYDTYLELFRTTFDSFGDTTLMTLFKFGFLKQSFPKNLKLYEANSKLNLIELMRAKKIRKKDILGLSFFEEAAESRLDLIRQIEKELRIFIYTHDLELLIKHPRAFDSFMLSLAGRGVLLNQLIESPKWSKADEVGFIIPKF